MPPKPNAEPDDDRFRELSQAMAAIEVAVCVVAVFSLKGHPKRAHRAAGHLRLLSDFALFETDSYDPEVLDRMADLIENGYLVSGE